MASYEEVRNEVKRFLQRPANNKAEVLVLRGAWGVGKTYMVRTVQEEVAKNFSDSSLGARTKNIKQAGYAEVSLFGLNALEDVRRAICFGQSDSTIVNLLKDAPKEVSKFFRGVGGGMAATIAFSRIRNTTICIDDLERHGKNLSVEDVLGFISMLKEQRSCNIILIMNEGELSSEDKASFEKYSEKVIDLTLTLSPEPQEAIQHLLKDVPPDMYAVIEQRCKQLGITNLRTVQKIIRCAKLLRPYIQSSPDEVKNSWISSLILLMCVHDNPHNKDVPDKEFICSYSGWCRDFLGLAGEAKNEQEKQQKQWWKALENYGFHWDEIQDAPVLFLVEHGYLRGEDVRCAILASEQSAARRALMLESDKAWEMFHANFSNNEAEVLQRLYETTRNAIAHISASNVDSVVHLLRESGHEAQANVIVEACITARQEDEDFLKDLDCRSMFGPLEDVIFKVRINAMVAAFKAQKQANLSIESIINHDVWNDKAIAFLSGKSVDDYYHFFKGISENASYYGGALLSLRHVSNATEQEKEIVRRVIEALKRIGEESPFQKARLSKFQNYFDG